MTRLTVLLFAFSAISHAQTACKPDYQVSRSACKQSSDVERIEPGTRLHFKVQPGACLVPNAMALCNEHKGKIEQEVPGAFDIVASNPTMSKILEACGSWDNTRAKVDVFCDFSFKQPVYKMIADDSCPIENIRDANGCFENANAEIDPSLAANCLSIKPKTDAELYGKALCLSDLDRAAKSFRVTLNAGMLDKVEGQLEAIKGLIRNKAQYQNLSDLLEKQ